MFSPVETINSSSPFHLLARKPGQMCPCLKFKRSPNAPVSVSSETSAETPCTRALPITLSQLGLQSHVQFVV